MKKLMIAAAIVCASVFAQAATCNWNAMTTDEKYVYAGNSSDLYSGDAYVFMITDTLTQSSVFADLYKKTDISTISGGNKVTVADGVIASTSFTTDGTGSNTQNFFLAIVKGDNFFISKAVEQEETLLPAGNDLEFNAQAASKKLDTTSKAWGGTASWYAAESVPEPTSGLLLLLGVAGLALRRRRA